MKKMKQMVFMTAVAALMASCTVTRPYAVTNNTIGDGVGVSRTNLIFGYSGGDVLSSGISTNSDFGVIDAAKQGDLDKVATVDVQVKNFIIFQSVKIIVTGTQKGE